MNDFFTEGVIVAFIGLVSMAIGKKISNQPIEQNNVFEQQGKLLEHFKSEFERLDKEMDELRQTMDERDLQHKLERDKWERERQSIMKENERLNLRVTLLEEALEDRGVNVEEIIEKGDK